MLHNLDYYKKKLLWEKQNMLEQIEEFNDKGYEGLSHSLRDSTSELSNYDNHPADGASDIFDRSKDIGMRDNARLILQMIDDAINKINSGQYGVCESCGHEINEERLDIMPYTTYCRDCKAKSELPNPKIRPIEEEVIQEIHQNDYMITDSTDNIAHDGEDTWQDVARYGTSNSPSDIPGAHNSGDSYIDGNENVGIVAEEEKYSDDNIGDD